MMDTVDLRRSLRVMGIQVHVQTSGSFLQFKNDYSRATIIANQPIAYTMQGTSNPTASLLMTDGPEVEVVVGVGYTNVYAVEVVTSPPCSGIVVVE